MALHGTLEIFALSDLLRLLSSTHKSGRLHVSTERATGTIWLADGELGTTHLGPGSELPAVDVLFELLRSETGDFEFDTDLVAPTGREPVPLEPVLTEAEAMLHEWQDLSRVVPSMRSQLTFTTELDADNVSLDRDQWRLLRAIGAGTTPEELGEEFGLGELSVTRAVRVLVDAGLLSVGDEIPIPEVEEPHVHDDLAALETPAEATELVVPDEEVTVEVEPVEVEPVELERPEDSVVSVVEEAEALVAGDGREPLVAEGAAEQLDGEPAAEDLDGDDIPAEDVAGEDLVSEDLVSEELAAEDVAPEDVAVDDLVAEDLPVADLVVDEVFLEDPVSEIEWEPASPLPTTLLVDLPEALLVGPGGDQEPKFGIDIDDDGLDEVFEAASVDSGCDLVDADLPEPLPGPAPLDRFGVFGTSPEAPEPRQEEVAVRTPEAVDDLSALSPEAARAVAAVLDHDRADVDAVSPTDDGDSDVPFVGQNRF